ncbi:MAG: DUF2892 domain-containing protein [Alphaproteobacteria bacterium]|nr:DUF2892 domain-containing protein [Alphaproteobacteria bacterium]MDP6873365.1 DUF2892 domain-containing protein [Alphaproteobacteria bacterium]
MNIDRLVIAFAGTFIVASLALGHFVHPAFLLFTLFVGLNLFQAGFTGFCPLAKILAKFGQKPGHAFN